MAERWGINIYFVWNTTIVPLSVCRAFLVITFICVTNHVRFLLTGPYFVKNAHITIFSQTGGRLGYTYLCRMKDHYSPLKCMSSFFSYNLYLREKIQSSLAQQGEFLSRNPDISIFFSKWPNAGYAYLCGMKDHYSLLECMSSFFYNLDLHDNSRSFFAHRTIFCKKCLHKLFFPKMTEGWGYKYLFRMKYHYIPLECMPSFFSHNVYLRDKSRSFFAHRTIFCKKCSHKQFFLKMAERWGIHIYVL